MTRKLRIIGAVAAAPVLALAGYGIASASIPDSGGVIHACYQSPPPAHGANLQVIDTGAGGSCGGGMVALTWNQTGPQGPAGATGPTGPQGPAGPSTGGASGLDLQIVVASNTLIGGVWTPNPLTVTCPSDHPFLFGGAGESLSGGATTNFPDNGPSASEAESGTGPHGWTVGSGLNDGLRAFAICGK